MKFRTTWLFLSFLILAAIFGTGPTVCQAHPRWVKTNEILGHQPRCFRQQAIFVAGQEGYDTFRIPALVVSPRGTVLAFCEGRKTGKGDSGDIDLVLRRSQDGGETWEPLQVVWDDGVNTCGNPAPVVDRESGIIWLLMTHNDGAIHESDIHQGKGSRDIWITHSANDGLTWSQPELINDSTKESDWRWVATGPCHGIQLSTGRLLIPCDHSTGPESNLWHSHVIFSDDRGKTWQTGGQEPGGFTNESTVAELADGTLYLNMRSYKDRHRRQISYSRDGGIHWSEAQSDADLAEPRCQGSVIRFTERPDFLRNRLIFSNPARDNKREGMTVKISYDESKTWPCAKLIYAGPSAYSDLAVLPDFQIGLLYERGDAHPYETLTFARMTLAWLTDGQDSLNPQDAN